MGRCSWKHCGKFSMHSSHFLISRGCSSQENIQKLVELLKLRWLATSCVTLDSYSYIRRGNKWLLPLPHHSRPGIFWIFYLWRSNIQQKGCLPPRPEMLPQPADPLPWETLWSSCRWNPSRSPWPLLLMACNPICNSVFALLWNLHLLLWFWAPWRKGPHVYT